jgi:hypothetical protein
MIRLRRLTSGNKGPKHEAGGAHEAGPSCLRVGYRVVGEFPKFGRQIKTRRVMSPSIRRLFPVAVARTSVGTSTTSDFPSIRTMKQVMVQIVRSRKRT